jgi:hypothetical protein
MQDNLEEAQHIVDSGRVDKTEAVARALIDIARSLRSIDTWVNEYTDPVITGPFNRR